MSYEFTFKGRKYYADAQLLSPQELDKFIGASRTPNTRLITVRGTTAKPIAGTLDITLSPNVKEIPVNTEKGASRREIYIKAQVASIAEVYGERYGVAVQLEKNLNYLFIPRFPLPRRWGERETPLLIQIPAEYPDTPPHGFFLSSRCNGPHVFSHEIGGENRDFNRYGWNWFCVHCDKGWKPGPSPLEPMTLWDFLSVIQTSLTVNEF